MMLDKLNEMIHLTRAFFILLSFIIYFILFFLWNVVNNIIFHTMLKLKVLNYNFGYCTNGMPN